MTWIKVHTAPDGCADKVERLVNLDLVESITRMPAQPGPDRARLTWNDTARTHWVLTESFDEIASLVSPETVGWP